MSVERIIVETNDETGNNPVEYDWEFDPDGVCHMSGDGGIPAVFEGSAAIVEAFNHVGMSIVNGERTPLKDGDRAWFTLLAVTLATLIPFVEGKDGDRVGFMMGDTSNGFNINITSPEFLACCRSMWVGADVYRAFGRYLNFRWDTIREAWVENGSGLAFIGADGQVAYMLETAMSKGDGIRFDPYGGQGGHRPTVPAPAGNREMRGHPGPIHRRIRQFPTRRITHEITTIAFVPVKR